MSARSAGRWRSLRRPSIRCCRSRPRWSRSRSRTSRRPSRRWSSNRPCRSTTSTGVVAPCGGPRSGRSRGRAAARGRLVHRRDRGRRRRAVGRARAGTGAAAAPSARRHRTAVGPPRSPARGHGAAASGAARCAGRDPYQGPERHRTARRLPVGCADDSGGPAEPDGRSAALAAPRADRSAPAPAGPRRRRATLASGAGSVGARRPIPRPRPPPMTLSPRPAPIPSAFAGCPRRTPRRDRARDRPR